MRRCRCCALSGNGQDGCQTATDLRALWQREGPPFKGKFYSTDGVTLEPYPVQQPSPPLWIGSWGSDAGLRRVARLGDGWLASAYNTTPEAFANALGRLGDNLRTSGKDPNRFPNALATMYLYVTEDRAVAERIIRDVLKPALNRPEEDLSQRLLVGSAEECTEKLAAYRAAGVQRIYLWPVADELRQLVVFQEQIAPMVGS